MSSGTSKRKTASKKLFIISPIGEPKSEDRIYFDKARRHIIDPIAIKGGYETKRADDISKPGRITKQIIERLREDDLVVADLTGRNPNVFYELAVRHAVGKSVILMAGIGAKIPFDVAAQRVISYDLDPDNIVKAREELARQISEVESATFIVDSPIEVSISLEDAKTPGNKEQQEIIAILRNQSEQLRRLEEILRQESVSVRARERDRDPDSRLLYKAHMSTLTLLNYESRVGDLYEKRKDGKTKMITWADSFGAFLNIVRSQKIKPRIYHDDQDMIIWFDESLPSPNVVEVIAWTSNPYLP